MNIKIHKVCGGRIILPHKSNKSLSFHKGDTKLTNEANSMLLGSNSGAGVIKITDKTNGEPVNLTGLSNKLQSLSLGKGLSKPKKTFINFRI